MKKRITILISWLLFSLSVSNTSVFANSTEDVTQVSQKHKSVDYTLPFPGLLPDHPLYFLRFIRDTMQHVFVSESLKKAEFYLLQADKGISASAMLSQKKETVELAGATAIESQQHFENALDAVGAAKKQGVDIHEITKKLVLANKKHQEMLIQIKENSAEEHREAFIKAGEKAQALERKAKSFLPAH